MKIHQNINSLNVVVVFLLVLCICSQQTIILEKNLQDKAKTIQKTENLCGYRIENQDIKKLALIIPTHLRVKNSSNIQQGLKFFNQFLKPLVTMQCEAFQNIYFIWNNQETPEQLGLLSEVQNRTKNVFFLKTSHNALDYRYLTPKWMEQQVLLSIDDDVILNCQNIKQSLKQWNQKSIGSLGPIASYFVRIISYNMTISNFTYSYISSKQQFMNCALTGFTIFPRHLMQLYYSNFFQLKEFRKIVYDFQNCEDIAINFINSLFYSQFPPFQITNLKIRQTKPPTAVSANPQHRKKRDYCANQFSKILGKNPLMYVMFKDSYLQSKKRSNPMQDLKCLSIYKKYLIEKNYLNHEEYYLTINHVYVYFSNEQSKLKYQQIINQQNQILNLTKEQKKELIQQNIIDIDYKSRSKQFQYFEKMFDSFNNPQTDNELEETTQSTRQKSSETTMTIINISNIIIVMIIVLIVLGSALIGYLLIKMKKLKKILQNNRISQINNKVETQSTTERIQETL